MDIVRRHCCLALHAAAAANLTQLRAILTSFGRQIHRTDAGDALRVAANACAAPYGLKPDWPAADAALEWATRPSRSILLIGDPGYPPQLGQIADPPPVLYVRGRAALLPDAQIAIVGSRKPTAAGREISGELARELTRYGLLVTSGLAYGIDAQAHRGALAAGGPTIAVLGCGIDGVYPRQHADLAVEIAQIGALVSEFPLGSPPLAYHFPRRNRIISGLSVGTVVVEAAAASGSIITAMQALEQGREVFAVPGSIRNPLSQGCHALIKEGARLVESVDDILDEIGHGVAIRGAAAAVHGRCAARAPITPAESCLLDACGDEPTPIDVLVARSGLTAPDVSSMLLTLELKGYVEACYGASFMRKR